MTKLYNVENDCKFYKMTVRRTKNQQNIILIGKELNRIPVEMVEKLVKDPRIIIEGTYKTIERRKIEQHNKEIRAKIKKLEKEIELLKRELK